MNFKRETESSLDKFLACINCIPIVVDSFFYAYEEELIAGGD